MQFKLTLWFGLFALTIGVLTLLGRVFRWKWLFTKVENRAYWEPWHVVRYTIMPFGFAVAAIWKHFSP